MIRETVLITGASTGIGYELAKCFAQDRCDLILVARNREKLEEVADQVKGEFMVCDLSNPIAVTQLLVQLLEGERRIDVLVNNAGFGTIGDFVDTDIQTELDMVQTNISAVIGLTRALLPAMLKRKSGGVLNVASTAAFQPGPGMSVYYATKSFVLSWSQALAEEVASENVVVSALCPGPTKTEFQKRAGQTDVQNYDRNFRVMSAADVARLGYEGFRKGKRVVIPGMLNKVGAVGVRFVPTWMAGKVAKKLNKGKKTVIPKKPWDKSE